MGLFSNRQEDYKTQEIMFQVYSDMQIEKNKKNNHVKKRNVLEQKRNVYSQAVGGYVGGKISSKLTQRDSEEIEYANRERIRFDRFFYIVLTILVIILLPLIIL